MLLLDTGDALIGGGVLGDLTRGEAIVAGMNLMHYDAMALGARELSLGPELLRERMDQAEFAVLSANVKQAGAAELFASAHASLAVGDRQVAVIGLTAQPSTPVAGFEVLEPRTALEAALTSLQSSVRPIILLTNMDYGTTLALVSGVPGVDLAVAANPAQLPQDAAIAPGTGTIVVVAEQPFARHTGRRVGRLEVLITPEGEMARATWQSVPMTPDIPDKPQMQALLDAYR